MTATLEKSYTARLADLAAIPPRGRVVMRAPEVEPRVPVLQQPRAAPKRGRVTTTSTTYVSLLRLDGEMSHTLYLREFSFFSPSADAGTVQYQVILEGNDNDSAPTYTDMVLSSGETFRLTYEQTWAVGGQIYKGLRLNYPHRVEVLMRSTDGTSRSASAYMDVIRALGDHRA